MCYPNFTILKFVAIFIFLIYFIFIFKYIFCILLRICLSLQAIESLPLIPPKQIHTLMLSVIDAQPYLTTLLGGEASNVLRVGSNNKLYPTLKTSPAIIFHK